MLNDTVQVFEGFQNRRDNSAGLLVSVTAALLGGASPRAGHPISVIVLGVN